MTPEIISNIIVGALSLVAGGGVWQYWIARGRAPIDRQGADIAAADTTVGMTLAFAQQLTKDYDRLSAEFKTEREERKALAERFRILEAALYEEKQINTQLSGIIREFNLSWDDLEGRWDTHRLLGQPPLDHPDTSQLRSNMVNMNVQWAGPNASLATLAGTLNSRFGAPSRPYEYVTGYKAASNITGHNADANGRGHSMDIFVGAGQNISVEQGIDLAEKLRLEGKRGSIPGHPDRLAYIIHRGRIAGDHTGWEWVAYNGIADHYDHIHVSSVFDYYWGDAVVGNPADYNSTAAWDLWGASTQAGDITPITEEGFLLALSHDEQVEALNLLRKIEKHTTRYLDDRVSVIPGKVLNTEFPKRGAGEDGKPLKGNTTVGTELGWQDANFIAVRKRMVQK